MVEPVSITIGSVGLFLTVFTAGKAVYDGWHTATNFPNDMRRAHATLNFQWLLFCRKASLQICDLRVYIDPENPDHENTKALLRYLRAMVSLFAECDQIIKAYGSGNTVTQHERQSIVESPTTSAGRRLDTFDAVNPEVSSANKLQQKLTSMHKLLFKGNRNNKKPRMETTYRGEELGLPEADAMETLEGSKLERFGPLKQTAWALRGKRLLNSKIKELRSMNKELTDFLAVKSPQDLKPLYPNVTNTVEDDVSDSYGRDLKDLHDTIQSINRAGKVVGPFMLSIKIQTIESEATLRADFDYCLERSSGQVSRVFLIQRHQNPNLSDIPTNLLAETSSGGDQTTQSNDLLGHLDGISQNIPDHGFAYWGRINNPLKVRKEYKIYHRTIPSYSSVTTLDAIVGSREYRDQITAPQLLKTAEILTIAYLTFFDVRTVCRDPDLDHFRYYRPQAQPGEEPSATNDWAIGEPLILEPWLFFGFGAREIRHGQLGQNSAQRNHSMSILKLGLLLYQLASGDILTYRDNEEGLRRARQEIFKGSGLHRIDEVMSSAYRNLVISCLDFSEPAASPTENRNLVRARLMWMISQLRAYEKYVADDYTPVFPAAATIEMNFEDGFSSNLSGPEDNLRQQVHMALAHQRTVEEVISLDSTQSSVVFSSMTDGSMTAATTFSEKMPSASKI